MYNKYKMKKFQFRSVVAMANSKLSVKYAAILLSLSTLISALLGIFRDRLLNSYYLDTYPTGIDAYTAAFTIPDFMFFVLTSGALAVSFIPVFNQRLISGNKKSAWELSSSILNLMAVVTLISSILIMILADPLVRYIVGPGLDESGTILAINMMRVIAINPFLFSIATVLNSIQQAVGRFVFFSLAPALYNVGILIGITFFTNGINLFGLQLFEGGIMGVAIGVVFGAILQIFISLIGLFGLGFDYQFKIYWKNLGFKTVLKLLPARSLDQGIDYIYSILATNLSSRMGKGAVEGFQRVGGVVLVGAEEGAEPEFMGVGLLKEVFNEVKVVAGEHLRVVVLVFDQVFHFFFQVVEEHGVAVDVLEEELVGGLPVLAELDLPIGVVQVEQSVQRVVVELFFFAGRFSHGLTVGCGHKYTFTDVVGLG